MAIEKITKEVAKKLTAIKGETRGLNLKDDAKYVLAKKGPEGLKRVEAQLKAWGHPIEYEKIKSMDFVPAGLKVLSLLAIKTVFNWGDREIREVGIFHLKTSLIIKFFVKYFYSIHRALGQSSRMWREYWTVGELAVPEFNEEEKRAIIRLEGVDFHPIYCRFFEGYIEGIAKMVIKSPKITCREIKCAFKGDKDHEFLMKW